MDATLIQLERKSYGFIGAFRARNPLLFDLGVAHIVLLFVMLLIAPFDGRLVTGINPWIKPMKFAASIAIFVLTMAWVLYELPLREKTKLWLSRTIAATQIVEIVLITMQAARGVTSHFNNATAFDSAAFSLMGAAIVLNTIVVAYIAFKFWKTDANVPAPYLWGIRLGLVIFVLASLEGFAMVSHSAHSVGVADGGAGLPVLNWSTKGGDLRVAHFFGMHALQLLPLAGYLLSSQRAASVIGNPSRFVQALGICYALVAVLLFLWALAGRPLVSL